MEREFENEIIKEKFGRGYYYSFTSYDDKEVVNKIRKAVDEIVNPPRYDFGLSLGFTYTENEKLNKIKEILDGSSLDYEKLVKINEVLKQNDRDVFCLTSYSDKLNRLQNIVEKYLKRNSRKYIFSENDNEEVKSNFKLMFNAPFGCTQI